MADVYEQQFGCGAPGVRRSRCPGTTQRRGPGDDPTTAAARHHTRPRLLAPGHAAAKRLAAAEYRPCAAQRAPGEPLNAEPDADPGQCFLPTGGSGQEPAAPLRRDTPVTQPPRPGCPAAGRVVKNRAGRRAAVWRAG